YRLVGYGAPSRDELVVSAPSPLGDAPLVWLAAADRPTADGNAARRVLRGELEFKMSVAPEQLWDILDIFVPPLSSMDSLALTRMPELYTRENRQPRLPLTLRLNGSGSVRADTILTRHGKTLRLSLVRLDTISVDSRF
ncbi:MAG TPA: hypothetical protein VFU01_02530, partial [Gemmatimonadaceae bacterium]|nr:hypothetical protein [Gemmatimonadaceae bacterium]